MKRILIYCEGPSEETFVNRIIAPSFYEKEIFITASSCNGISKYSIMKKQLKEYCRHDRNQLVTMMVDYYGLHHDVPGMQDSIAGDIYTKINYIENAIKEDIAEPNFISNLILHEFEALLFSNPECFEYCDIPQQSVKELCAIASSFATPEHINNAPNTAPSKRILSLYPSYNKIIDGYAVAELIGLPMIRKRCHHFDAWLKTLEFS